MDEPTPDQPEGKPKKGVSTARNVIGVVLLAFFATFAGVEFNANRLAKSGAARLDARLAKDEETMLSLPQVNALLGKSPDAGPSLLDREQKLTYTWHGFVRKHGIVAYYNLENVPKLKRYEGF